MDEATRARRRKRIGASEIGKIVAGEAFEVYLDKMGMLPGYDNPEMYWGRVLEPVVMAEYARRTGRTLYVPDDPIVEHPEIRFLSSTPDRWVKDEPDLLVEGKTGGEDRKGWGRPGTDQVPPRYYMQAQWQMASVTAARVLRVDIPVFFSNRQYEIYTVARDEEAIAGLLRVGEWFWGHVERRQPPPFQVDHPDAVRLLTTLYRPAEGVKVELGEDCLALADAYLRAGEEAAAAEARRKAAHAALIERMRDAGEGTLPDGRRVVRQLVEVKEHVRAASQQARLYVKKAREE